MKEKISILGCGWVGKELKTTLEKKYLVFCLEKDIEKNQERGLYDCDWFIIGVPPRGNYIQTLEKTLSLLNNRVKIIFLSSTSFYKNRELVCEGEKTIEKIGLDLVILRLAGLMGYDRIAGKFSGGKIVENTKTNYVHRDDVIKIIKTIIEKNITNKIYDVVAPIQCSKKEIFEENRKKFGFEKPIFIEEEKERVQLSSDLLIKDLEYEFIHKKVKDFWS